MPKAPERYGWAARRREKQASRERDAARLTAEDLEAAIAASVERSEMPEQYRWDSDEAEVPDSRRGVAPL